MRFASLGCIWLVMLAIVFSSSRWSVPGGYWWIAFASMMIPTAMGAWLMSRTIPLQVPRGVRVFMTWLIVFLTLLGAVSSITARARPGWVFDVSQQIKYPRYYAWRNGNGEFPASQFWQGFNTDRYKKDIFLGKSRGWIQERLPLVKPLQAKENSHWHTPDHQKLPLARVAEIEGSLWLMGFDKNDICVAVWMNKG